MRWRYWSLLLTLSVLVHLAVFWPVPTGNLQAPDARVLSVRLSPPVAIHELSGPSGDRAAPSDGPPTNLSGPQAPRPAESESTPVAPRRDAKPLGREPALDSRASISAEASSVVPVSDPVDHSLAEMSLVRYRLALAVAAVRMQALEADTTGLAGIAVVEVRLTGGAASIALAASSGVPALDQKALALLARAVRVVPPPKAELTTGASVRMQVLFEDNDA